MSYRLGVDVGGTFTDFLLIDEKTGSTFTAKVPSTPEDSSIGVLNGVSKICDQSGINPNDINLVMHGTTVATNAVLTGNGATVGLLTTQGYESVLQVARSFCPGGLGGWVSFVKKPLLAPLELTHGVIERTDADGTISTPLNEKQLKEELNALKAKGGVEALTISFVNSYVNDTNEQQAAEIAKDIFKDIPISISSEVIPEMQEYERAETTVEHGIRAEVAGRRIRAADGAIHVTQGDAVGTTDFLVAEFGVVKRTCVHGLAIERTERIGCIVPAVLEAVEHLKVVATLWQADGVQTGTTEVHHRIRFHVADVPADLSIPAASPHFQEEEVLLVAAGAIIVNRTLVVIDRPRFRAAIAAVVTIIVGNGRRLVIVACRRIRASLAGQVFTTAIVEVGGRVIIACPLGRTADNEASRVSYIEEFLQGASSHTGPTLKDELTAEVDLPGGLDGEVVE